MFRNNKTNNNVVVHALSWRVLHHYCSVEDGVVFLPSGCIRERLKGHHRPQTAVIRSTKEVREVTAPQGKEGGLGK